MEVDGQLAQQQMARWVLRRNVPNQFEAIYQQYPGSSIAIDPEQCLPALTIGNGFASLDDARPKPEISEPAFVKHRAVTGFGFDFEPRLAIKAMV